MSTLTWTETHPAWSPAPVFEAEIADGKDQRNYLQIYQLSRQRVAIERFVVTRIALPGGERAIDGPHVFGTLAEAQAAAQVYFDTIWTPALAAKRANDARVFRQVAQHS